MQGLREYLRPLTAIGHRIPAYKEIVPSTRKNITPGFGETKSNVEEKFIPRQGKNAGYMERMSVGTIGLTLLVSEDQSQPEATTRGHRFRSCLIIYDGACSFCHGGVRWLVKKDKWDRIKFCCMQSGLANAYMERCRVTQKDIIQGILLIEDDDTYHRGCSAALRALHYLPRPYSIWGRVLSYVPKSLGESVYDKIVRKGHKWFVRGKEMLVLNETELLDSFIDWEELLRRQHKDEKR